MLQIHSLRTRKCLTGLTVILLKIQHKMPLSGEDRLPHWIFADPCAMLNVSICLQKKNLVVLSNYEARKKLHNFALPDALQINEKLSGEATGKLIEASRD